MNTIKQLETNAGKYQNCSNVTNKRLFLAVGLFINLNMILAASKTSKA